MTRTYGFLKGVSVLKTKSFKAFVLLVLISGCLFLQIPSSSQNLSAVPTSTVVAHAAADIIAVPNDELEDMVVNDDSATQDSDTVSADEERESSFGIHEVVQEGVKIMDMFVDTDNEGYQAFRSMLTIWNPESSKWATQASKKV